MKTSWFVISVLLILSLALIATVPARADRPGFFDRISFEGTTDACGPEFPTLDEYIYQGMDKCNPATGLCGFTYHVVRHKYTVTNPENDHSLVFHGSESWRITYYEDYGIIESRGIPFFTTVPGYGIVWGAPGKSVIKEFNCRYEGEEHICDYELLSHSGPTFPGELETICSYLLGE